jgi:hypothetical protein
VILQMKSSNDSAIAKPSSGSLFRTDLIGFYSTTGSTGHRALSNRITGGEAYVVLISPNLTESNDSESAATSSRAFKSIVSAKRGYNNKFSGITEKSGNNREKAVAIIPTRVISSRGECRRRDLSKL